MEKAGSLERSRRCELGHAVIARVAPRNRAAAMMVLRVWIVVLVAATVDAASGGRSPWLALLALAGAPLLMLAASSARTVEISAQGVMSRGLVWSSDITWDGVRNIRWLRHGGVERYRVQGRFASIDVCSGRRGFDDAARLLEAQAAYRGIPIAAG